jgi:hypothetical protein
MSQPSNQPAPRFVVCRCQFCDGHIEFDANELAEENSIVPCPHCGLETKIFVPPPPAKIVQAAKPPVQTPPKLTPDCRHEQATPKQVAYLTFMGVPNAAQLSKKDAAALIEANSFCDEAKGLAEFNRQRSHQDRWHIERLILYPDLYAAELNEYLHEDLPRSLHAYVRKQIVGASEILTKAKIRRVIDALNAEKAGWWHQSNHEAVFFERLTQTYPSCCDGLR